MTPSLLPDSIFPPPEQAASQWGDERLANHFEILSYRVFISPSASYGRMQLSRDKKHDVREGCYISSQTQQERQL